MRQSRRGVGGFLAVLAFMVVEYGRPMDLIPVLGYLRPGMLTSIALALALARDYQRVPWLRRQYGAFAALLAVMVIWVPLARNNYFAFAALWVCAQYYLMAVAIATFVDTPERFRRLTQVWVVTLGYQALWGLTHGGMGNGSFLTDENDFALAMSIALPFAVLGAPAMASKPWKTIFLLGAGLFLAAIIGSFSRGGFIALLAVGVAMLMFTKHKLRILALSAVAVVGLMVLAPAAYWKEIATIADTDQGTAKRRTEQWKTATTMWLDNPIFGVGQGNVPWNSMRYEVVEPHSKSEAGRQVHSLYFTLLPELGILGVVIFGTMFWFCARDLLWLVHHSNAARLLGLEPFGRAIMCGFVGFLSGGIFISVLYYPHAYYLLGMTVAARALADRGEVLLRLAAQTPARELPKLETAPRGAT